MTDAERQEARKRCEAATPGPWYREGCTIDSANVTIADVSTDDQEYPLAIADADFIAHARTDLPKALDALDAAHREIAEKDARIQNLLHRLRISELPQGDDWKSTPATRQQILTICEHLDLGEPNDDLLDAVAFAVETIHKEKDARIAELEASARLKYGGPSDRRPWYNVHGDSIRFCMADTEMVRDWLNPYVSWQRNMDSGEILGFDIGGVIAIIKEGLRDLTPEECAEAEALMELIREKCDGFVNVNEILAEKDARIAELERDIQSILASKPRVKISDDIEVHVADEIPSVKVHQDNQRIATLEAELAAQEQRIQELEAERTQQGALQKRTST